MSTVSGLDDRLSRRIAWLMLARVVLLLVVLAAAVVLNASTGLLSEGHETRVLQAVLFGLVATAFSGLLVRRLRNPLAFGSLQIATDVCVATAIVHVTGGSESVFSFLYVIVVAYAALLFDRRLAVGAALFAGAAHAVSLVGLSRGWGVLDASFPVVAPGLAVADAAVKACALLVVAALASGLARELARADRALDERTRDFGRLQNLHEHTVQSLGSGLLTTDLHGVVRSFNREAERITGVAGAASVGRQLDDLLPGAGGLLAEEDPRQRERLAFEAPDGALLHLGFASSVLRDTEGRASGHVVIFQDITAIVAMEDELRQTERLAAVGELAAGIAHEVRNPLASISGSVEMLRAGLPEENQEERRLMDIVLREADRLDGLISDFLRYARPAPPRRTEVALTGLVDELREMYDLARPPGVDVSFDVPEGLEVLADADQLKQLLWNLLLNAGQAMDEDGELTVTARRSGIQERGQDGRNPDEGDVSARIEVAVADTGSGISPELLDRVFDPFFTTKANGSGLGLAMVHRIVEANGGTIRVESEVGKGTTFRVNLADAQGSGEGAPAATEAEGTA